jgi:hypothetical protein
MNQSFKQQLDDDIQDIIHCLTAPPARDDSEAEYERICELSIAMQGWQAKYGDELISQIYSLVKDIPNKVALVAKIREENS